MLKNQTQRAIALKYNSKTAIIAAGGSIDLGEAFGMAQGEIRAQEARFIAKNPMCFVYAETGTLTPPLVVPVCDGEKKEEKKETVEAPAAEPSQEDPETPKEQRKKRTVKNADQ